METEGLEILTSDRDLSPAGELIAGWNTLRKMQTEFTTAVAVQKPRDRKSIIRACEEEAAIAGDEFFYAWTVKTKEGPKLVEGLSIQAALAAARNWGNCAIPCHYEESVNSYTFIATFLDMETGFNLQRTYKQRKKPNIGMKDPERAEDIVFQIGQSKAIRNVILNALPSWLTSKMLIKAKEEVIEKIKKMGLPVAREKVLAFFKKYSIDIDRIEKKLGKNQGGWNEEDLALLQGAMNSLTTGQESADSLFPPIHEGASIHERIKEAAEKQKEEKQSTQPASGTDQSERPNSQFLETMAREKIRLGDAIYYAVLGDFGVSQAEELTKKTDQDMIIKTLKELKAKSQP